MLTYKIGSDPFYCLCVCATIDAMLNFNGDVDTNADVKCEQNITYTFRKRSSQRLSNLSLESNDVVTPY